MMISTIIVSALFNMPNPIVSDEMVEHNKTIEAIGYRRGLPIFINLARIPSGDSLDPTPFFLQSSVANQWINLIDNAQRDGHIVKVNYAFRTIEQQRAILRTKDRKFAARAGESPHQLGIAIDIRNCVKTIVNKRGYKSSVKTPLFYWLKKNAAKFGFANTMRNEPWHWEYILNINNENS